MKLTSKDLLKPLLKSKRAVFSILFFICFIAEYNTVCAQTTDTVQSASITEFSMGDTVKTALDTSISIPQKKLNFYTSKHAPWKAALFSSLLPGLGQAYNKKYWKIPIVYTGLAGFSVLVYTQNERYQGYRNAYILQADGDPFTRGSYRGRSDASSLDNLKRYYKRNLDLSITGLVLWYALNLIDATVDGHLYTFNVDDNLSLKLEPEYQLRNFNQDFNPSYVGLKLTFYFKKDEHSTYRIWKDG